MEPLSIMKTTSVLLAITAVGGLLMAGIASPANPSRLLRWRCCWWQPGRPCMPEKPRLGDRRAPEDETVDVPATVAAGAAVPDRRMLARRLGDRLTRFVARLRPNAAWIKSFLHGKK